MTPSSPIFVGIDLAWSPRNPSGGAVMVDDRIVTATGDLRDDSDILTFIARHLTVDGPAVIGVDAPLRVPNSRGSRTCDVELTRAWGRFEAGALPANRGLLERNGYVRGEELVAQLSTRYGVIEAAPIPRHASDRLVCELYPHPAHVSLFDLPRTLKYKARQGRDYPQRWAAIAAYQQHLAGLAQQDPPLYMEQDDVLAVNPTALRGRALKRLEDTLDAVTCAYAAAYLWHHGPRWTCLYGDVETGHIMVPLTARMEARLG